MPNVAISKKSYDSDEKETDAITTPTMEDQDFSLKIGNPKRSKVRKKLYKSLISHATQSGDTGKALKRKAVVREEKEFLGAKTVLL